MRRITAKGGTALSEAKKQNYLHGAAIMVGTTVIVKIAAFFYKLPLGSMKLLGDEGFAHFMVAYNIYSFFLTLATAGFPVALSRMISEADTLDRPAQVQRIFRTAAGTLAAIGGFFTLLMLLFNRQLAVMMGNADAAPSILALAPAVVIVCLTSAYRGYCQGRGNMIPTAFGQVIEEVGKLIAGLTLAFLLIRAHKPLPLASAGAIFGVTAGAVGALIYMMLYKRRNYPPRPYGTADIPDSRDTIVRSFLRIGIPIAIGSSVLSLINLLDNALCLNRLQSAAGSWRKAPASCTAYTARRRRSITCRRTLSPRSRWASSRRWSGISRAATAPRRAIWRNRRCASPRSSRCRWRWGSSSSPTRCSA